MMSHGQCPRAGVLVNVQDCHGGAFSIFRRADDVTQAMSKGGGVLVNVFAPPPSGNPVSAPGYRDPPPKKKLYPIFRPLVKPLLKLNLFYKKLI